MNPETEEIKLLAQKDRFRTYQNMDAYIRDMMVSVLIEMEYKAERCQNYGVPEYEEFKIEYGKLKEAYQKIKENPKKFVTFSYLKSKFKNDFYIQKYFNEYVVDYIENAYPKIKKLNFLGNMASMIKGKKTLKQVQADSLTQSYFMNCYMTPYGMIGVGDIKKYVTQEFLDTLHQNENLNIHDLAVMYAKELKAEVCTGYINSSIPKKKKSSSPLEECCDSNTGNVLRTISSWLEKEDYCYDLSTGTVMPKIQYYEFYEPNVKSQVSYHELKNATEEEIPYVLFLAYQAILKEQKEKTKESKQKKLEL